MTVTRAAATPPLDLSHACDSGGFSRVVCPEPCGAMHSYCVACGTRQDFCPHEDEDRDSFAPVSEHGLNVGAVIHDALTDLIADHPMFCDAAGEPLDYDPEREGHIATFVGEATDAIIARLRAAAGTATEAPVP